MPARAPLRSVPLAIAAILAAGAVAWIAGCSAVPEAVRPDATGAASRPRTDRDRNDGDAGRFASGELVTGELVIGELEPATRGVRAGDLVRAAGSVARYAIVGGDGAARGGRARGDRGEVVERVVRETGSDGRERIVLVEERGGKVESRMELEPAGDGALTLSLVDAIGDGSRSLFATPLPFAADLAPGAPLEGASDMRVVTLPGGRARAQGTATRTLRIAGECDLRLGDERLRAIAIDLAFAVELDVAKADVRARLFIVPGCGVVAEAREESRVVLGVFRTSTRETTALLSVEGTPAPDLPTDAR
ncbi:MAG: hypothetical protein RI967_1491 [Planctomycetota bacterium]